ncbi:MAG: DNA polymerase III subunit alpha, partial [Chitinophagia bacterium]|nr:DNA polymerase III subunit alpha [Chitinophagia bacterium]
SIKDVARALDLPLNESNILTKMVPERPGMSLKNIFNWPVNKEGKPEAKDDLKPDDLNAIAGMQAIHKEDSLQGRVFREAEKLEGSVRNTGIHAAGIIIAPEDITNLLPVCMTKDVDAFITQFEGNVIERAGVIKMDILGLKTLTEINDAIKLIEKNYGITIDIDNIPLDDPKTFALFQAGETTGTFQFESPGMQKYLIGMKPDKFEDLIAINALYRPGPMAYIPEYIKRKHGQAPITYDIEAMSEHLSDTYGITVYQEQVMLLSQSLGAFSKGDADNLRKAMGKKQIDVLNKMKSKFLEGATKNGHPQAKLEKIWGDWEEFAKYAFNKSHATCYAYVAYQTAYLKAHYPAEYMAAVLNNKGNIEDIKFYMEECKRMKIKVLGPDVNESLKGFSVPNKNIRFGLNAIKGIGEAAVDDIIADREKNGAYLSVYDFFKRVNQKSINKKTIENLTLAGAFDSFNSFHRAQYFYVSPTDQQSGIERLVKYGAQVQADSNDGGMSLFMDAQMPEVKPPQLPECPKWQLDDMLEKEKEVVGLYLTAHPLDAYKFEMENFGFLPVTSVPTTKERSIKVAGILSDVKVFTTKSGKEACHFTLNDYSGCYKFTLWDKEYAKYYSLINERGKIAIYGSNEPKRFIADEYELVVSRIIKLDDLKNTLTKKITLYLNIEKITPLLVDFLKNTLYGSKGNIDISFEIVKDNSPARVSLKMPNHKISLTQPLIEYLNNTNEVQYMLEANHSVG